MKIFGQETGAHSRFDFLFLIDHISGDAESCFRDDSCATLAHDLLCVGSPEACRYWFMTAADDWPEVTHHLRALDGTNTVQAGPISPQELSQVPFDIYFHIQRKGDLVILPPRRY